MNRDNESTIPVATRLTAAEIAKLARLAASSDRTVAAEMRRGVRQYLARHRVQEASGKSAA